MDRSREPERVIQMMNAVIPIPNNPYTLALSTIYVLTSFGRMFYSSEDKSDKTKVKWIEINQPDLDDDD